MKTLVCWHGWGMRSGAWHPLTDHLKNRFNVVLPSLPGYDDTPFPTPYTAEAVVDALLEKQAAPITLCGWSMGAMLSLLAAHRHPDKIERLILFSATPSYLQRENWPHAMPPAMLAAFARGIAADADAALRRFITLFNHNDANAKSNARELGEFNLPPQAVLDGGLEILRDLDVRAIIPVLRQPVLLIHGARDPLMPLAAAQWLATALPNARLHVCEDAAHAPFISSPAHCADWVTDWLTTS